MAFCTTCGKSLKEGARFCTNCGKPTAAATPPIPIHADMYAGEGRAFPLFGDTFPVSPQLDAFVHYRAQFHKLAKVQAAKLSGEYHRTVTNLDQFLTLFPQMYLKHRQPLLEAAMDLLVEYGIYDLSVEQFSQQHTADFCLCGEDVDIMVDSFNKTIEANQQRKANNYNRMPGIMFRGITGIAAAFAVNMAVNAIAEADIRNADVTARQRAELFARIDTDLLMERAFIDYWRVFLSLTWTLNSRGAAVWYPDETSNQRATGIYQNLCSGRIPQDKVPQLMVTMLQLSPYMTEGINDMKAYRNTDPEIAALIEYFGYDLG